MERIGNPKVRSDTAEAGISSAQADAARANLLAEQEKLARVELQKLVEWRTITPEQQKEIAARLKRFPKVRIAFTVNAGDPEGFVCYPDSRGGSGGGMEYRRIRSSDQPW